MWDIKNMLLGIAIMLAVIIFHLFIEGGVVTDVIAIFGLALVFEGYNSKSKDGGSEE